ncbi:hypothetical protein ABTE87_21150, partial [Acinetobacter baumannii]
MADELLTNGKAYEWLRQLTKQVGGRLAGSPQFEKAVKWGEAVMKEAGADHVMLQECMMPNWNRGSKDEASIITIDG